ncbi:MAG: nucleotide exchange factor GrpE [bacterium]
MNQSADNSPEEKPAFQINEKRRWMTDDQEKAPAQSERRLPSYVEQLERRTKKVEEAFEERKTEFREEQAAFRRRVQAELEKRAVSDNRQLLEGFIKVLDCLDMALASAGQKHDFESLLKGLRLTRSRFLDTLKSAGVSPVAAEGEKFDPGRHEAFMMEPVTESQADNTVLEVLQAGYLYKDQLIRPAKVKVGKLN